MTAVADSLPLVETQSPADQGSLAALMVDAFEREVAVYPIGGGTSLDYGLPPTRQGMGLSLAGLNRVVDYPARDMTVTVEAGITMGQLGETLAAGGQWLPIDVPQRAAATLGGVMATATSGARRYGYGTMRDYVIGVSAVDGRGQPFKSGGRVVKNVAGYDFCKLLTGSLGTLGVITQITLKVKPLPESSAFLVCDLDDLDVAERLLSALVHSATTPVAVELLTGPAWRENPALGPAGTGALARLAVGLEGTSVEVEWMLAELASEWRAMGVASARAIAGREAELLWSELAAFPASPDAPLVIKATTLASETTAMMRLVGQIDPEASIQAHAGNGVAIARFANFESGDISRTLIGRLQPAAGHWGGGATVLSSTAGGLTRQAIWGGASDATAWMRKVKQQFDPKNLLNPGRFVYDNL
jgi:glycolate oxidase FAD binding subunit